MQSVCIIQRITFPFALTASRLQALLSKDLQNRALVTLEKLAGQCVIVLQCFKKLIDVRTFNFNLLSNPAFHVLPHGNLPISIMLMPCKLLLLFCRLSYNCVISLYRKKGFCQNLQIAIFTLERENCSMTFNKCFYTLFHGVCIIRVIQFNVGCIQTRCHL